jgi:hypothetical protein
MRSRRSSASPKDDTISMRVLCTVIESDSRLRRHNSSGCAFESATTSRQFSGRSSMTASSDNAWATRPRAPLTNTAGMAKPWDWSQR